MTLLPSEVVVRFGEPLGFEFAKAFLEGSAGEVARARLLADSRAIHVAEPVLGKMLQRLADGQSSVLLWPRDSWDYWMLVGGSSHELERTLAEVSRFLIPTYGEFQPGNNVPIRLRFDPSGPLLQRLGAQFSANGYYRWVSPVRYRDTILRSIEWWLNLTTRRPVMRRDRPLTYRDELTEFESALAAADWHTAQQTLDRIRRSNLTTADNLDFLVVEFLAQQQRWRDLWEHPDYERIARMRMPLLVRAAMLTAFHAIVLLPHIVKGQWSEAMEAYLAARPRLGGLVATRATLRRRSIIDVFAFEACRTSNAADFTELEGDCDDLNAKETFEALARLNPSLRVVEPPTSVPLSPLLRAQIALLEGNYDEALQASEEVQSTADRVGILIEIAYRVNIAELAQRAVLEFWELPKAVQDSLFAQQPVLQRQLAYLLEFTHVPDLSASQSPPINDWFTLLNEISVDEPRADLSQAMDRLNSLLGERHWSSNDIIQLSDILLAFADNSVIQARSITQRAVSHLIDHFLRDPEFPRMVPEYADLYEVMYLWQIERAQRNEIATRKLIRLAEAILRYTPERVDSIAAELLQWLDPPRANLEEQALDTFELLAEYGFPGPSLVAPCRNWMMMLLHMPMPRASTSLSVWLELGGWIHPGPDLLSAIRAQIDIATAREPRNPIIDLAPGYRIGIFTLQVGSAERVRSALLSVNPDLDIQICSATDLNNQARALAQSADMPVIVSTCITHSLTYGIQPYLKTTPVYPDSSGSSSILRAIASRVQAAVAGVPGIPA